jgi:hypothetical protein
MKFKLLIMKNNTKMHKLNKSFTFDKIQEFAGIKVVVGKIVNDR